MEGSADHTTTENKCKDDWEKCENGKYPTETDHLKEAEVAKQCRPIILFLLITGINLNLDKGSLSKFIRMFYLFVLLIISIAGTYRQLKSMLKLFIRKNIIYIGFNLDHYTVIAIVYLAAFKNQKIGSVVRDIWRLFSEVSDGHNANRRLRRWVWALLITAPIYSIYLICYRIIVFIDILNWEGNEESEALTYFLIDYSLVFAGSFIGLLQNAFVCFAIVQCYLIEECYTCLNKTFKTSQGKDHIEHLNKHQEISNTVNHFNNTFQLIVLILVSVQMMSIASLIYGIAYNIKNVGHFGLYQGRMLLFLGQNFKDFTLFVYFGCEIRSKAQKFVNILLDVSISKHQTPNNEDTRYKNFEITTLFTARLAADPVVISAILFAIDYCLIAVVFSVTAAYFTVAPSLQPPEYAEYTSSSNAYNSSLSASLNASSLVP